MASSPIILITAGTFTAAPPYHHEPEWNVHCPLVYVRAVEAVGGIPLVVPPLLETTTLETLVGIGQGLLLSGGGDIASLAYGEEPHPQLSCVDPGRDACELALVQAALQRGIPILGICRGIQLLNVARGGTLIQDIPTQVSGAIQHQGVTLEPAVTHSISVVAGSILSAIAGTDTLAVNSAHHQALGRIGTGLNVTAQAADGVIEGIEGTDGSPLLGVQFHPEELLGVHPAFFRLFSWLLEAATVHKP